MCPLLVICISHFRPNSVLGHVVKFVWQTEIKCTVLTSQTNVQRSKKGFMCLELSLIHVCTSQGLYPGDKILWLCGR